jgi:23S rRNA pseudouridine1911/1915/1917 synthase
MNLNYYVKDIDNEKTLKYILKNKLFISNRLLTKLKLNSNILVNGKSENVNYVLKANDKIEIFIPDNNKKFSDKFSTEKNELDILYEDDYLLILNKPAGIPIHPSSNNYTNTLSNYVAYYLENKGINGIHVITRLDKNTSGICVFAKNEYIQELFIRKKDKIKFQKEYLCIVNGILKKDHDIIELPIARKKDTIILREVNLNGDYAKTEYFTLKRFYEKNYSVAKVILHTGKTHQIRVHMSHIGHTLLGDDLYASEELKSNITKYILRQALHCKSICFYHPITNEFIKLEAKIPKDMENII